MVSSRAESNLSGRWSLMSPQPVGHVKLMAGGCAFARRSFRRHRVRHTGNRASSRHDAVAAGFGTSSGRETRGAIKNAIARNMRPDVPPDRALNAFVIGRHNGFRGFLDLSDHSQIIYRIPFRSPKSGR